MVQNRDHIFLEPRQVITGIKFRSVIQDLVNPFISIITVPYDSIEGTISVSEQFQSLSQACCACFVISDAKYFLFKRRFEKISDRIQISSIMGWSDSGQKDWRLGIKREIKK